MHGFLAQHWWVFLLRGLFAVLFGILAIAMPDLTLFTLLLVVGIYLFADGVVDLYTAISGQAHGDDRWLVALQGLVGVAIGLIVFFMPGVSAIGLLFAIAAWSLVVGVLQIVAAIKLRKEIANEFWLGLSGLISILFALFLIARPGQGALAVIWIIGIYAIAFGVFLIAFAFKVRKRAAAA
jgi:uncharacterized membrane protein HdeD (DUF308 family)